MLYGGGDCERERKEDHHEHTAAAEEEEGWERARENREREGK